MKLRILNVLTKTAPTIPQTPHTDLKYPYVPKMAIRTHCAQLPSASQLRHMASLEPVWPTPTSGVQIPVT